MGIVGTDGEIASSVHTDPLVKTEVATVDPEATAWTAVVKTVGYDLHLCEDAIQFADEAIAILAQKGVDRSSLSGAREVRSVCLTRAGHAKDGLALGFAALASEDKESLPSNLGLVSALLAVGEYGQTHLTDMVATAHAVAAGVTGP